MLRRVPRAAALLLLAAFVAGLVAGCATSASAQSHPTSSDSSAMPGMSDPMPTGDGLAASSAGYTFVPASTTVPANQPDTFTFHITGPDGRTVTWFQPDQTVLMHFYLVRADLGDYQHLHPTMAADGTWTVTLPPSAPGAYRGYVTFTTPDAAGQPMAYVLSQRLTVPGPASTVPVPPAANPVLVDGYTLSLSGMPMVGQESMLTVRVSQDGRPVTDLQPYLDSYAHLSAFHTGDLAFAHLHPSGVANGDHGGPDLRFEADLNKSGTWRMFIQFQTNGVLHTAAFTVDAM
ncbi:MAG TPA: hypothetical protein VG317_12605 [Pseudonocardiaceae bacterium]|nr:hypothetical protein [Pseudonocardiaceae bacterium]